MTTRSKEESPPGKPGDREEAKERFLDFYWEARQARDLDIASAVAQCLRLHGEAESRLEAELAAIDAEEEAR